MTLLKDFAKSNLKEIKYYLNKIKNEEMDKKTLENTVAMIEIYLSSIENVIEKI